MSIEQTLARSFDIALAQYLASEGQNADTADTRGRLAARLVILSTQGETDEARLASNAVLYLRAFASAMRLASAPQAAYSSSTENGIAIGPDVISAISKALDSCLDDLPEGAATLTVRDHLQKALMTAASRGEQDIVKLKTIAMEKLRNRR